jgi:protocatechuate 3,4-dioxygenase, alpha subunit
MALRATSSQTVGPFFSIGLERLNCAELAGPGVEGERVTIAGRVLDADGVGVPDAIIELWQANSHGKYAHPEDLQEKSAEARFQGFGRIPTDEDGRFRFTTVKPGAVPGPDGKLQAPHIVVSVFMRGLLRRAVTRIYFPDELGNAGDFALSLVDAGRRGTLIAGRVPGADGLLKWDVIMQGPGETVFFDC